MLAKLARVTQQFLSRGVRQALLRQKGLSCPICAEKEPILFESKRPQKVYICPDCRHLFWDCTPNSEELAQFYRQEYCVTHKQVGRQEVARDYYRGHVEELVQITGRSKKEVCLVDYGSSIPVLIHEAQDTGVARPIAVDLDEMSWDYARRHGLSIMTPEQYAQLPDHSVDIVRFAHVLEHLIDPVAAIAVAARKLRPGGLLYITQPNFPVLKPHRSDYHLKDSVYPGHLHFFSPISLTRLVSRFPFQVLRLYSVTRHQEVATELSGLLDLDYASEQLSAMKDLGEANRGVEANYPYYTGENSTLYARRLAS